MTRWWLGAILLMFLSISVTARAGEITCDTFPANSLSRRECEYRAARRKALPAPDAGVVNLGIVPAGPSAGMESIGPDDFCGNPYQYEGKNVVLRGLQFKKALGRGSATFGTEGGREILWRAGDYAPRALHRPAVSEGGLLLNIKHGISK